MFNELILATVLAVAATLLHSFGLLGLSKAMRFAADDNNGSALLLPIARVKLSLILVLGLMTLHGLEIWMYALAFISVDAVSDIRTAVYFSTISYAAIGYSDADIKPEWALVAAIEGIQGLILIGWSTAYLVTVMVRARR